MSGIIAAVKRALGSKRAAPAAAAPAGPAKCWGRSTGCRKVGMFEPTVRVWASAWAADRKSANFQMSGMAYCAECRGAATAAVIMDEKMRGQIDRTWKADGKPVPDWSTVKVVWTELPGSHLS